MVICIICNWICITLILWIFTMILFLRFWAHLKSFRIYKFTSWVKLPTLTSTNYFLYQDLYWQQSYLKTCLYCEWVKVSTFLFYGIFFILLGLHLQCLIEGPSPVQFLWLISQSSRDQTKRSCCAAGQPCIYCSWSLLGSSLVLWVV